VTCQYVTTPSPPLTLGVHRADGDAKVDWVPRAAMGPMGGQGPARWLRVVLIAFMVATAQTRLEPHGRLAPQPVRGLASARHRRHHRPISERNGLPTHPQGRYHSIVPLLVNFVRDQSTGGVLKFNSLRANFEP
jgi:hypothetical protein